MRQIEAEKHAQLLWNSTPCGEVESDSKDAKYFMEVERARYGVHPWILSYFPFDQFLGKRVLEIGVGHGTDLIQFARNGAECFGVDITDAHLELTAKRFQLENREIQLYKTSATELPFDDNTLDCIYSLGVIHHIPDADKVVSECFRVLKPGGKIMITNYYKYSAFHICMKLLFDGIRRGELFTKGYQGLLATIEEGSDGVTVKPHVKLYTKSGMKRLLKHFELTNLDIHHLGKFHFYPVFIRKWISRYIPSLEKYIGWYITALGEKVNAARK